MWFLATAKRVISGGSDSFGMPSVANLGGKFWYHPTMEESGQFFSFFKLDFSKLIPENAVLLVTKPA